MPSFDAVSQVDLHELTNAVDQANREIGNRFDFKGTNARVEQDGNQLTLFAPNEFQVDQVLDLLRGTSCVLPLLLNGCFLSGNGAVSAI